MQKAKLSLKIFMLSRDLFNKMLIVLQSGFTGLWLGLLSREALYQYDQMNYDKSKMYQDDTYNLSGLFKWEKACLDTYFTSGKSILLPGAGGGREVIALHRLGYQVDGYECNPRLTESANEFLARQNVAARVSLSPRDAVPQTGKLYDGIIAGWGMYMHIQNSAFRIAFLNQLRKQCKPGAPILLSFFSRKNNPFYFRFIPRVGNIFRWLLRRERVEMGDYLLPIYVHYFMEQEVASEMKAAGFQLVYYCTDEYGHAVGLATE